MAIDDMGPNCLKILHRAENDLSEARKLNTFGSDGAESLHKTAEGILKLTSLSSCQTRNSGLPCAGNCQKQVSAARTKASGLPERG